MKYDKNTNFFDLRCMADQVGILLDNKRMQNCCSSIGIYHSPLTGQYAMNRYRCGDRFCPICNHVKSTIISTFLSDQYEKMKETHWFISLTLTIRNCNLEELPDAYADMARAWRVMWNYHKYKYGYYLKDGFRHFECTYNKETGLWHPHYHALITFPKSQFSLDHIASFDFGGRFANGLQNPNFYSYAFFEPGFGKHFTMSDDVLVNGIPSGSNRGVTWMCEEYDPYKTTMFEFSKYITKFKDLIADLTIDQFKSFYDFSFHKTFHQPYGSWKGYRNKLPKPDEDIEGSVWVSMSQIRQNLHFV